MKKNVLVFPCGSEIGLEIHRSVRYSAHFNLIGGNSVPDHGEYVYEQYIGDIPFVDDPGFAERLIEIITKFSIDLVYPTMDSVITKLWQIKDELPCKIVGATSNANEICFSKKKTARFLKAHIPMPETYDDFSDIRQFPVFLKPEYGYSSKGTAIAYSNEEITQHMKKKPGCLIMEFLPGEEYTIDCFTDRKRKMLFAGPRLRKRIAYGISVNTSEGNEADSTQLKKIATIINEHLLLRGAWFFQAKRSAEGNFKVMEVAARLGGSSALFRAKGINFALLSLWDALDCDVSTIKNKYSLSMDRALDNKYKIDIAYQKVYVDFDDTLVVNQQVNIEMIGFLYQCLNEQKELICISRHAEDLKAKLIRYKLENVFDEVIHLKANESKSAYIRTGSIFIDDSYGERKDVAEKSGVPVFSPDMVGALMR